MGLRGNKRRNSSRTSGNTNYWLHLVHRTLLLRFPVWPLSFSHNTMGQPSYMLLLCVHFVNRIGASFTNWIVHWWLINSFVFCAMQENCTSIALFNCTSIALFKCTARLITCTSQVFPNFIFQLRMDNSAAPKSLLNWNNLLCNYKIS